jgi:hypothetical protein
MRWILDHVPLPFILFAVVAVIQMIVKALKPKRSADESSSEGAQENDEERRVREIQERLRRISAERRGQRAPVHQPEPPPLHMPEEVQPPPVPAAEPLRRNYEEIERRLRPAAHVNVAEVERQQRLQEEMEALEEKKFLAARHELHRAEAELANAQSEAGLRMTARARLLEDLRDPQSVRRAIVLREVLGAPVGLR